MNFIEEYKKEQKFKKELKELENKAFIKHKEKLVKLQYDKRVIEAVIKGKERAERKPLINRLFQTCKEWLISTKKPGSQAEKAVEKIKEIVSDKKEEKKEDEQNDYDIFNFT